VADGNTGHAEAIQIEFDPSIISYEKLLEVFFKTHDPTTPNQQGADVGSQYRSMIFYHDQKQKEAAELMVKKMEGEKVYGNKIVTQLEPYSKFYTAEDYHQDYYAKNPNAAYCRVVIDPKIQKLYKEFKDVTKEG
jgi:peptide-methionine (S)-S-oxide reductase